jgi:hypothetical protein
VANLSEIGGVSDFGAGTVVRGSQAKVRAPLWHRPGENVLQPQYSYHEISNKAVQSLL